MRKEPTANPSRESGFTVIELVVSLLVVVEVLLAVLMLIDFSSKLSRAQVNVTDMQQSLRVAHHELAGELRMAGTGGLPGGQMRAGGPIWIRNNAGASQKIGPATSPEVLDGTDVLILRGVFSTPLYHVNTRDTLSFTRTFNPPGVVEKGTVVINIATSTKIPHNMQPLLEIIEPNPARPIRPEALLLIHPRNAAIYSVVELDTNTAVTKKLVDTNGVMTGIQLGWKARLGTYTTEYAQLSPGGVFNPALDQVAFVGVLEEYRYYIRESYAIPNNAASELTPTLMRARAYPNVDTAPYAGDVTNWEMDVADNILDLQIAFGLDSTNGGGSIIADTDHVGLDDRIFESADGAADDWLFNGVADVFPDPIWINAKPHLVRLSMLGRTDRRDPKYQAPALTRIEDRAFAANHPLNVPLASGGTQRLYRRRVLQTLIDLRNL